MAIGQENKDNNRRGYFSLYDSQQKARDLAFVHETKDEGRKDFTLYDFMDRGADSKYPSWTDGAPNLQTYLNALNKSQPIIGCQFELVWSRWPRTLFFSKGITIPGVSVNTLDLSHAGFTIKIPTHVTYENTEITLNIIADKEGFHYYDLRNMVLQTGHPLVAGDPKSTIGNPYGISPDEDMIEVRLRNRPGEDTHHHWIIHNFKPTGIGDIELSVDSASFVEFELTGTFTHITYDCGFTAPAEEEPTPSPEDKPQEEPQPSNEEPEDGENSEDEDYEDDYEDWMDFWDDEEESPTPLDMTSVMSTVEATFLNGDGESASEITLSSVASVNLSEPCSEEDIALAQECNEQLSAAQDELQAKLEEIAKMPADPNYNPNGESWTNSPDIDSDNPDMSMSGTIMDAPRDGQTPGDDINSCDNVFASPQVMITPSSQAQLDATKQALQEYTNKTNAIAQNYKDSKQGNGGEQA